MQVERGKTYVDESGRRRSVYSIVGDVLVYRLPLSGRLGETTLAEFEASAVSEYQPPAPPE